MGMDVALGFSVLKKKLSSNGDNTPQFQQTKAVNIASYMVV